MDCVQLHPVQTHVNVCFTPPHAFFNFKKHANKTPNRPADAHSIAIIFFLSSSLFRLQYDIQRRGEMKVKRSYLSLCALLRRNRKTLSM